MTGPNIEAGDNSEYMRSLQEKNEYIYNWMEDALEKGQKVVYISIGSECTWEDWSINAVKEGL